MRLITLYLPESYLRALDELVRQGYYPNRAEAIRVAVRDLLKRHRTWEKLEREFSAK